MEFESCVFELVKAVGKKAPFATKNPQMLEALFASGATVQGGDLPSPGHIEVNLHVSDWATVALEKGLSQVGPVTQEQIRALWENHRDNENLVLLETKFPLTLPALQRDERTMWACVNVPTTSQRAKQSQPAFRAGGLTIKT